MTKKLMVSLVLVLFVAAFAFAQAEAPKKPAECTITGTVQKTVDADGKLIAVKVVDVKVTYDVVLDANGTKLAELNGKKAQVKGTVEEKDGKKLLTVASFKDLTPPAAPAEPKK